MYGKKNLKNFKEFFNKVRCKKGVEQNVRISVSKNGFEKLDIEGVGLGLAKSKKSFSTNYIVEVIVRYIFKTKGPKNLFNF